MKPNFYPFAIFFTVLVFLTSVLQSLFYFQVGGRLYTLQSAPAWYIFAFVVYTVGACFLLKYFHFRQYRFTFIALVIAAITLLIHAIVVFRVWMAGELATFNNITSLAVHATHIVYATSLIFSVAGTRPLLKTAGIMTLIHEVILLSTLISFMTSTDGQAFSTIQTIQQWTLLFGSLIPLVFVLLFLSENRKVMGEAEYPHLADTLARLLFFTGIVALGYGFILGKKVSAESSGLARWFKKAPQRASALAEPFEGRTYVNDRGDSLLYRLLKPVDYDPAKTYPLVVCLHGGSGWGTDNVRQIDGSPSVQLLSMDENRKKYPAFLLAPQCPPGFSFGGVPKHPGIDSLIFEAMDELEKEFSIDTARRYVIGESLGGYGTWYFIATRPRMFAAAVPVCGVGDPALADRLVNVPLWAFHGRNDRNVPVRGSSDMIAAIRNAGGDPRYTEYADAGHAIAHMAYETPELLPWMFAQQRK